MSPAHQRGQGRWVVITVVVLVLAGVAIATRNRGVAGSGGPPPSPAALVSASGAESSAWYCTGPSTPGGQLAVGNTLLTNTTASSVSGIVSLTTDTSSNEQVDVTVPPYGQLVPTLAGPASGTWAAESVTLSRGGVLVSQSVHGPAGWSETPCQSASAPTWYFPSGRTDGSNGIFLSLFNPTTSPDVVDLAFYTPSGVQHPINFQGIVINPGAVTVANVSAYIQNQSAVATVVSSRTGRVVATELEQFSGNSVTGLSIVSGEPLVSSQWGIPQSEEAQGGSSEIDVFNPGSTTEDVTVRAAIASGPLAPITQRVLPGSTWVLQTSAQTRIPAGAEYATAVTATGGPGVVVGRVVSGPSSAAAPQAGLANAIDQLTQTWPSHTWVVPAPTPLATGSATAGAPSASQLPEHLALANPTAVVETYTVTVMTSTQSSSRARVIRSGSLRPGAGISIGGTTLFRAGLHALMVRANGPLSVSEDVGPAGTYGAITMPGIALAGG